MGRSYNCVAPRNYNTHNNDGSHTEKCSDNFQRTSVLLMFEKYLFLYITSSVKRIVSLVLYKINATLIFLQHHLQSGLKSTNVKRALNKIKLAGNQ
jgi:hypothetical protein